MIGVGILGSILGLILEKYSLSQYYISPFSSGIMISLSFLYFMPKAFNLATHTSSQNVNSILFLDDPGWKISVEALLPVTFSYFLLFSIQTLVQHYLKDTRRQNELLSNSSEDKKDESLPKLIQYFLHSFFIGFSLVDYSDVKQSPELSKLNVYETYIPAFIARFFEATEIANSAKGFFDNFFQQLAAVFVCTFLPIISLYFSHLMDKSLAAISAFSAGSYLFIGLQQCKDAFYLPKGNQANLIFRGILFLSGLAVQMVFVIIKYFDQ